MAERKFDYENVKSIYEKINRTIGSDGDSGSDTIIGILNSIDKTYKDMVNVKDKAVLGDLGRQLLLDWENTSSDFPASAASGAFAPGAVCSIFHGGLQWNPSGMSCTALPSPRSSPGRYRVSSRPAAWRRPSNRPAAKSTPAYAWTPPARWASAPSETPFFT